MANLWLLYKIQQLDTELNLLLQKPKPISPFQQQIESVRSRINEQQNILEKLKKTIHQGESQNKILSAKKQNIEKRLYGGLITNSKEMESCKKELETVTAEIDANDEKTFLELEKSESAENTLLSFREQLELLENQHSQWEERAGQEKKSICEEIASIKEEREKRIEKFEDKKLLETFFTLQKTKNNLGIAKVSKGLCGGCFKKLPNANLEKLGARELEFCSNCGRILFSEGELKID